MYWDTSTEGKAQCPRSVPSGSTHPRRETPIRAPFLRPRALNVFAAGALTAATVPAPARPVRTTHRPRERLGVPGRSHRDLPIRTEKHRSARRSFARERRGPTLFQRPARRRPSGCPNHASAEGEAWCPWSDRLRRIHQNAFAVWTDFHCVTVV